MSRRLRQYLREDLDGFTASSLARLRESTERRGVVEDEKSRQTICAYRGGPELFRVQRKTSKPLIDHVIDGFLFLLQSRQHRA